MKYYLTSQKQDIYGIYFWHQAVYYFYSGLTSTTSFKTYTV